MTYAGRQSLRDVHLELLEKLRYSMNLIGPGPAVFHFEDAERAFGELKPVGRWADLGTGAGFPGMVLAADYPGLEVHLVDSRLKRCLFLEQVVDNANAEGIEVHCTRLEKLEPGQYDGITGRALAAPAKMLDFGRDLLKPGGHLLLFLQDEAPVPDSQDYETVWVNPYTVDGKRRKSALLKWTGA